ncbi:helix-turn-helix transcriptional regulator [Serratia sp. Lou2A]|uniref:Helix-turn-helix transcriptional regulator n=2 Tax=Serratia montpellierensis TaxID=2598730 RepID=A0ABS8J7T5_9GAMM|nr:helix-turn-helix transcriptional regulator [Serratia sp. Lou2A]MCC7660048.1 helix-turn-helix transcriptional regulator [Serratia sp. Pon4B]
MRLEPFMKNKNYHNSLLEGLKISDEYISVLSASLTANTEVVLHKHDWGQLNVINIGVMEININNEENLIAPWQYSVWIPPGILHSSYNEKNTDYCSISIPAKYCHRLSATPCIIEVSEINRAIINDLLDRHVDILANDKDLNLSNVIIDQLEESSKRLTYLPSTTDKYISPIIEHLHNNPGDNCTLQQWGKKVFASEKTLSRRFNEKLHMPFREWRSRLRFIHSLSLLKTSMTIQEIAWQLGYGNPSSFIIMFEKISGTTPDRYRKNLFIQP